MNTLIGYESESVLFDFPEISSALEDASGTKDKSNIIDKILKIIQWCAEKIKELVDRIFNFFRSIFTKNKPVNEISTDAINAYKTAVNVKNMKKASKIARDNNTDDDSDVADISSIEGLGMTPVNKNDDYSSGNTEQTKLSAHNQQIIKLMTQACTSIQNVIVEIVVRFEKNLDDIIKSATEINTVNQKIITKFSSSADITSELLRSNKEVTITVSRIDNLGQSLNEYKNTIKTKTGSVIDSVITKCDDDEKDLVKKNLTVFVSKAYRTLFSSSTLKQKYGTLKNECDKIQSYSDKARNYADKLAKNNTNQNTVDICNQINTSCRANVKMVSAAVRVINMPVVSL